MGHFLHGWRRKAACVTLAMACVLTAAWIRSYFARDEVHFGYNQTYQTTVSVTGGLSWTLIPDPFATFDWHYSTTPVKSPDAVRALSDEAFDDEGAVQSLSCPYWALVLPLTLLSADLILWMPRKRGGTSSTQMPVSTQGGDYG